MCVATKAPGKDVGRLGRAVCGEVLRCGGNASQSSAVSAAKVSGSNAERDAQRMFNRFGMTAAIPMDKYRTDTDPPVEVPNLSVENMIRYLYDNCPCILFGGETPETAAPFLRKFWSRDSGQV